jgi:hypothetical protein
LPASADRREYDRDGLLHRGAGVRFNLPPPTAWMPSGYGFVEASHRYTNETTLSGDRIFAGLLLQY